MGQVITGHLHKSADIASCSLDMFRMRYRVFHERMQWDVKVENGLEIDEFDDPKSIYQIYRDKPGGKVLGSWRLRPTTEPYMMADVFPQLLYGESAPKEADVWEISRFAVEDSDEKSAGLGLGSTARDMVLAAIAHAVEEGYRQYVMVVSVAVERLLKNMGLELHRYGRPIRIGRVLTVACSLDINEATRTTILGKTEAQDQEAA